MPKPRLLVFASGTKDGGGSGFERLVVSARTNPPILQADIVAVVSNHATGGVRQRADRIGVSFIHFPGPFTAEEYQRIVAEVGAEWVALSGWLKLTAGLNPTRTFNIHPGPLPEFGGDGMYGHYVHEAVLVAFRRGEIKDSAVCMHFVTLKYDEGPVFFRREVPISVNDTVETLAARVNAEEHEYQSLITNLVINGDIRWDGKSRVRVSEWYARSSLCPENLRRPK